MFEVPALAPKVQDAIDALRADGVTLTDADVVWLSRLRAACDAPEPRRVRVMMSAPLQYAGVTWWPLHRLADEWWRAAYVQLEHFPDLRTDAFLMAHQFSAPGDSTLLQWTGDMVPHALVEWRVRIPLHDDQVLPLIQTLKEMDGLSDVVPCPSDGNPTDMDHARSTTGIMALCRAFPGTTPDYWDTHATLSMIDDVQSAFASKEGWANSDERTESIKRWLSAVRWLRNRGKTEEGDQ